MSRASDRQLLEAASHVLQAHYDERISGDRFIACATFVQSDWRCSLCQLILSSIGPDKSRLGVAHVRRQLGDEWRGLLQETIAETAATRMRPRPSTMRVFGSAFIGYGALD